MNKILIISRSVSVALAAFLVVAMPIATAQAADLSGGSSYDYYVPDSSSDYGSSYDYFVPDSSSDYGSSYDYFVPDTSTSYDETAFSYDYFVPDTSNNTGYSYDYVVPDQTYSTNQGYSYDYFVPDHGCGTVVCYTYTNPGCSYNCGGGCSSNCGCTTGCGGCHSNCGGCNSGCGCTSHCGCTTCGCSNSCPPPPKPLPSCTLSFSPSQINYDGDTTISWSSSNATSAYLSGYGSVSTNGSHYFSHFTGDQSYTLSVSGPGGDYNCNATVTVHPKPAPICSLTLSRNSVQYPVVDGQQPVTIYWSSSNANSGWINQNIGNVSNSGSQVVYPHNTTTYTGTFTTNDGRQVSCSATVSVNQPPIVYAPPVTPYVTLSAVPYTGLDLGPVGTVLYWGFLIAWCLFAAYLIVIKRAHMSIARWYSKILFGTSTATHTATTHSAPMTYAQPVSIPAQAIDPFILSQINRARN